MGAKIEQPEVETARAFGLLAGIIAFIVTWIVKGSFIEGVLVGLIGFFVTGTAVLIIYILKMLFVDAPRAVKKEWQEIRDQAAAENAAKAKQQEEARLRKERRERVALYGKRNSAYVESALTAIETISRSEAARDGWLGDVAPYMELLGPEVTGQR